jgi:hypothetical protein
MRQVLKWAAVPVIAATVLLACNKGKPTSTTPTASDALKGSCLFDNCKHGTGTKNKREGLNFFAIERNNGSGNGFYSGTTTGWGNSPNTNPVIGSSGDNIIRDQATKLELDVRGIATEFDKGSMSNSSRIIALVIDANQDYVIYTFANTDPNVAQYVATVNKAGNVLNTSNSTLVDIEYDYNNQTINGGGSGSPFMNTEFRILALDQMNNEVMSIDWTTGNVLENTTFPIGGVANPTSVSMGGNTYNGFADGKNMIGVPISLGWLDCGNVFSSPFNFWNEHGHPFVLSIDQSVNNGQLFLSKFTGNDYTQGNGSGFHFGWCSSLDDASNKPSPYDPTAEDYGIMYDHYGSSGFIIGNDHKQFGEENTAIGGPFYGWSTSLSGENAVDHTPFIDFAPGKL